VKGIWGKDKEPARNGEAMVIWGVAPILDVLKDLTIV